VEAAVFVWFSAQIHTSRPLESRAGLACIALGIPVHRQL
jgi:hypothetical protein